MFFFLNLGADPAGPGFQKAEKDAKLTSDDAMYVQCIYTDGDIFGSETLLGDGHENFMMQNGIDQPGCAKKSILETDLCDHSIVNEYFKLSLRKSVIFEGRECRVKNNTKRTDRIGIYSKKFNSTFCVIVNAAPPYAQGKRKKNFQSNFIRKKSIKK